MMTSWWLQDDFRMSSGWLQDDFRKTSWWLQDDFMMTSWWLHDDPWDFTVISWDWGYSLFPFPFPFPTSHSQSHPHSQSQSQSVYPSLFENIWVERDYTERKYSERLSIEQTIRRKENIQIRYYEEYKHIENDTNRKTRSRKRENWEFRRFMTFLYC